MLTLVPVLLIAKQPDLGTSLLVQESMASAAPSVSAGTIYVGFFEAKANEQGDVLVMASIDDPAITVIRLPPFFRCRSSPPR